MNNEPVAWIAYDEFGDFMLEAKPEGDYPWQPLYTHPADLTDEEIIEVFESRFYEKSTGKIDDEVIAFARAILKKANRK